MCHNWGYNRLGGYIKKQAIDKMKHAEGLIERILFLDGTPKVDVMPTPRIGAEVRSQLENDLAAELEAVGQYNRRCGLRRSWRQRFPGRCLRAWSRTRSSTPISWKLNCTSLARSASTTTSRSRSIQPLKSRTRAPPPAGGTSLTGESHGLRRQTDLGEGTDGQQEKGESHGISIRSGWRCSHPGSR